MINILNKDKDNFIKYAVSCHGLKCEEENLICNLVLQELVKISGNVKIKMD